MRRYRSKPVSRFNSNNNNYSNNQSNTYDYNNNNGPPDNMKTEAIQFVQQQVQNVPHPQQVQPFVQYPMAIDPQLIAAYQQQMQQQQLQQFYIQSYLLNQPVQAQQQQQQFTTLSFPHIPVTNEIKESTETTSGSDDESDSEEPVSDCLSPSPIVYSEQQCQEISEQVKQEKSIIDQLTSRFSELDERCKDLENRNKEQENLYNEQLQVKTVLQDRTDQLVQEKNQLLEEKKQLVEQKDQLQGQLDTGVQEKNQLVQERDLFSEQLKTKMNEAVELQGRVDQLVQEKNLLQGQLDQSKQELNIERQKYSSLLSKPPSLFSKPPSKTKSSVAPSQHELNRLKQQLEDKDGQLKSLSINYKELQASYFSLSKSQADLQQLKNQETKWLQDQQESKVRLDSQSETIVKLKEELLSAHQEIDRLNKELKRTDAKWSARFSEYDENVLLMQGQLEQFASDKESDKIGHESLKEAFAGVQVLNSSLHELNVVLANQNTKLRKQYEAVLKSNTGREQQLWKPSPLVMAVADNSLWSITNEVQKTLNNQSTHSTTDQPVESKSLMDPVRQAFLHSVTSEERAQNKLKEVEEAWRVRYEDDIVSLERLVIKFSSDEVAIKSLESRIAEQKKNKNKNNSNREVRENFSISLLNTERVSNLQLIRQQEQEYFQLLEQQRLTDFVFFYNHLLPVSIAQDQASLQYFAKRMCDSTCNRYSTNEKLVEHLNNCALHVPSK